MGEEASSGREVARLVVMTARVTEEWLSMMATEFAAVTGCQKAVLKSRPGVGIAESAHPVNLREEIYDVNALSLSTVLLILDRLETENGNEDVTVIIDRKAVIYILLVKNIEII